MIGRVLLVAALSIVSTSLSLGAPTFGSSQGTEGRTASQQPGEVSLRIGQETYESNLMDALGSLIIECSSNGNVPWERDSQDIRKLPLHVELGPAADSLTVDAKFTYLKIDRVETLVNGKREYTYRQRKVPDPAKSLKELLESCKVEAKPSVGVLGKFLANLELVNVPSFESVDCDAKKPAEKKCLRIGRRTLVPSAIFKPTGKSVSLARTSPLAAARDSLIEKANEVQWSSVLALAENSAFDAFVSADERKQTTEGATRGEQNKKDAGKQDAAGGAESGYTEKRYPQSAVLVCPRVREFVQNCINFWLEVDSKIANLPKVEPLKFEGSGQGATGR